MERLRRVGTVLRNNWKKSVFLAGVAGYGANWYARKLEVCTVYPGIFLIKKGQPAASFQSDPRERLLKNTNVATRQRFSPTVFRNRDI
jgi:hypothetical protein